jgi:hypothetical protein
MDRYGTGFGAGQDLAPILLTGGLEQNKPLDFANGKQATAEEQA